MNSINGVKIRRDDESIRSIGDRQHEIIRVNTETVNCVNPTVLKPIMEPKCVVGIDVSNVKTGETENGMVYAFRGSIVWKEEGSYRFVRCGPLIFHLQEDSMECDLQDGHGRTPILSRLRNIFERSLQLNAARFFKDSIILLDGSLTSGTPDNPSRLLSELLEKSRKNGNTILAISKSTKLVVNGVNIASLINGRRRPCFIDVDYYVRQMFPEHPVQLMGRVLVAKLAREGFPFRIDVDKGAPISDPKTSLGVLLGNEVLEGGYPETLRLAHILSKFTESEIMAINSFLTGKYGLKTSLKFDLRKALFGPFCSGGGVAR
ncbi:MAG: DNA double-strand break repair nuclease NurA [Candidatus Bathyarchaeia archaeon]